MIKGSSCTVEGRASTTRLLTTVGAGAMASMAPGTDVQRHARITDRRRDHLHKVTTRLVRENHAVVIEDLQVRNVVCNHSLARAISDAAWRELRGMVDVRSPPRRYGKKSTQGRRDSGVGHFGRGREPH
jgi:IS605 OrfB family transposase